MLKYIKSISKSVITKLILTVGISLLLGFVGLSYFFVTSQKEKVMKDLVRGTDRLSTTIKLGTHYAMMLNSREDIKNIIINISRQKEIENIRIYNKEGKITFTNHSGEAGQITNIKDEACYVCHRTDPALTTVSLEARTRIFESDKGYRCLGILSPIYNEPSCANDKCHVHPDDKVVLGALDMVISLDQTDQEMSLYIKRLIELIALVLVLTSLVVFISLMFFVRRPMKKLMEGTQAVAASNYSHRVEVIHDDEIGQLASAFNKMSLEIGQKQAELNRQRDEYQNLFDSVPCIITVQDKNYYLLKYNREFRDKFHPAPHDYCYSAYKGLDKKCDQCPVEKTFKTGMSVYDEQSGMGLDGKPQYWLVRTTAIRDESGEIVAAMELCLDITDRKHLEIKLEKSEKKYHAIFNNIPTPVFVLDYTTFEILDVNDSVKAVYGYQPHELIGRPFLELRGGIEGQDEIDLKRRTYVYQIKHRRKDNKIIVVNIRVSPSEFDNRKVLLLTTSDITNRLEVEQQLHQASKLATLGEMATGVAHELNQPLSVIKTVSSFFIKKIKKKEQIHEETLFNMLEKVDSNVDRATKIITHMRLFARKSDVKLIPVQVNEVLERAFDIFNQQLKVRGIEVIWDLEASLPPVMADPGRLEQVFINLLINARDAIEEKYRAAEAMQGEKKITLKTRDQDNRVEAGIIDTGIGIPEENLDKIFDPFFTTKEVGKGTGLGLSISYGIIKDCHGDIKVSANDSGTAFIIHFPKKGADDEQENSPY